MKLVNETIGFEKHKDPKEALGLSMRDQIDAVKGMKLFTYWIYNLDHDWLDQVFGDTNLGQHFAAKWKGILGRSNSGYADPTSIMKMLYEMNESYREALFIYIYNKYKDERT